MISSQIVTTHTAINTDLSLSLAQRLADIATERVHEVQRVVAKNK
jgi:hypothetical protein